MIRNIILDMGNVLLDYNPEVILEKTLDNEEDRQIIRKELFGGPEWVQGDLGIIKNSERFDGVSQRVPSRLHPALRECVENWDICMVPVEGAVDFCREIKTRGYGMYVLSNACSLFYEYFPKYFPILSRFCRVTNTLLNRMPEFTGFCWNGTGLMRMNVFL